MSKLSSENNVTAFPLQGTPEPGAPATAACPSCGAAVMHHCFEKSSKTGKWIYKTSPHGARYEAAQKLAQ